VERVKLQQTKVVFAFGQTLNTLTSLPIFAVSAAPRYKHSAAKYSITQQCYALAATSALCTNSYVVVVYKYIGHG